MGEPRTSSLRTLEAYRLEIHARLGAARERSEELLASSSVSDAPQTLAGGIHAALEVIRLFVDRVVAEMPDVADSKAVDRSWRLLRSADERVRRLAPHLRYARSARPENLPWRFLRPVEHLAERLLGSPDSKPKILLRPQWHYNYSCGLQDHRRIYESLLDPLLLQLDGVANLNELRRAMPDPFFVISFPDVERGSSLLHALLGHEIGHLLADDFLTRDRESSYLESVWNDLESLTKRGRRGRSGQDFLFFDKLVQDKWERTRRIWRRALEELLSDLAGAYLFGPAALYASYELSWQQPLDAHPSEPLLYPPWRRRLTELVRFLDADGAAGRQSALAAGVDAFRPKDAARRNAVQDRIDELRGIAGRTVPAGADELVELVYAGLGRWIEEGKRHLQSRIGVERPGAHECGVGLRPLVERLDVRVPPNESNHGAGMVPATLRQILTAGWLHTIGEAAVDADLAIAERQRSRSRRNDLVAAAVQFAYLAEKAGPASRPGSLRPSTRRIKGRAGTLGRHEILERMRRDGPDPLVVTPVLSQADTLGDASVDLRLGNEFLVFTREAVASLNPLSDEFPSEWEHRLHRRVVRAFGDGFVVHPGQMVIGSTLEYLGLPRDVMAYVIGKSTWGRMGLVIATATKVDPGFRGCITLEIANLGEIPLTLIPGAPIAQIVLHGTSPSGTYSGSYDCATGPRLPDLSKLHESVERLKALR